MSVLTEAYAVPSRLIGVYRYLLRCRGQKENADLINKLLGANVVVLAIAAIVAAVVLIVALR